MLPMTTLRDARIEDAPFLARCILAGMHLYDFEDNLDSELSSILDSITECERHTDTLYSYINTRIAEVDGQPAGALLSYPGEIYAVFREWTFRQYWPSMYARITDDDPETDPGEYYLDSLAIVPAYRKHGLGRALIKDGIRLGLEKGFSQIALVADTAFPHLPGIYATMGFVPDGHRNLFGDDYLRMVYRKE